VKTTTQRITCLWAPWLSSSATQMLNLLILALASSVQKICRCFKNQEPPIMTVVQLAYSLLWLTKNQALHWATYVHQLLTGLKSRTVNSKKKRTRLDTRISHLDLKCQAKKMMKVAQEPAQITSATSKVYARGWRRELSRSEGVMNSGIKKRWTA
jgi:hypothetical protein